MNVKIRATQKPQTRASLLWSADLSAPLADIPGFLVPIAHRQTSSKLRAGNVRYIKTSGHEDCCQIQVLPVVVSGCWSWSAPGSWIIRSQSSHDFTAHNRWCCAAMQLSAATIGQRRLNKFVTTSFALLGKLCSTTPSFKSVASIWRYDPVELTLKQWLERKQWHSDANLKYPETMCKCSCRFILNICWQILAEHPEPFICEATSSLPPKVPHTCNLRPAPRAASHRTSASWRDPGPCLHCLISYYSTVNSN